ncbi:MAG: glycosyltransferase family 2 protein [Pseudomonadota bacterium]
MHEPVIGIAIPTWRGHLFIAETVQSALDQTGVQVRLHVGVDGADRQTAEVVQNLAGKDAKITIRGAHCGWVLNNRRTLQEACANANYAMLLPHDDIIAPDYCQRLTAELQANPACSCAYTDIQTFGELDATISQPEAKGEKLARMETMLQNVFAAVSLRGVMPKGIAEQVSLRRNLSGDYAADTLLVFEQGLLGDLRRIPEPLYRKRYHRTNTHTGWSKRPRAEQLRDITSHCAHAFGVALRAAPAPQDRIRLLDAAEHRLDWLSETLGDTDPREKRRLAECRALLKRQALAPS